MPSSEYARNSPPAADESKRLRIGFFAHPLPYGLYTVYRNLRAGLAEQEIELRWIGIGPDAARAGGDPAWASERERGEVVSAQLGHDDPQLPGALLSHLLANRYDGLIVNPPQSPTEVNLLRYLPPPMLRLMVVHSMAIGAYRAIRDLRGDVHAAIGVSPRVRDDLVSSYGFDPRYTHAVPNALDLGPFESLPIRTPNEMQPLRLLSFGRIEQESKGVFDLPEIFRRVIESGVEAKLTIAGDGPDLAELKSRVAALGTEIAGRIQFVGVVPPARIPQLVGGHDVFIMPSRCEGFGYTLIEAMAEGCLPIASRIRGVTDFIIRDGETGLLFKIGDVREAADRVIVLARDRRRLATMAGAAREDCFARFAIRQMGEAYAAIIRAALRDPRAVPQALPIERWKLAGSLEPSLTRFIPRPIKAFLRSRLMR